MSPRDVVDTAAEAGAGAPPLIVREPLAEYLDGEGSAPVRSTPAASGRALDITYSSSAAASASCCAARAAAAAADGSRRTEERRGSSRRSRTGTFARRVCSTPAMTSRTGRPVLRDGVPRGRRDHGRRARADVEPRASRPDLLRAGRRAGRDARRGLAACGLEGFGKPTGYLDRQLRRSAGCGSINKTRELAAGPGGRGMAGRQQAGVPARHHRPRRLPPREHDARARSARPADRDLADWEMATIGDPLADLRLHDCHLS